KQRVTRFADAPANHDALRVQQHDTSLQTSCQIDYVPADEGRVTQQFVRRAAVIALQPEAAAHAFEASVRAAKALGAIGLDIEVAEFTGPGVGSAENLPVDKNAAADSGRERHVEERRAALPCTVEIFAEGSSVGVIIHHDGNVDECTYVTGK